MKLKVRRIAGLSLLCVLTVGCGKEKQAEVNHPSEAKPAEGVVAHWELDREFGNYQPDEASSVGYLEVGRSSDASWGILIATGRITTRSHPGSDMLISVQDGTARIRIGDKEFTAQTGSLLSVPRGTPYEINPVSSRELHLVEWFTPALGADGTKFLEPPGRSAGKLVKRIGAKALASEDQSGSGQGVEDEFLNMKDYEDDSAGGK